MPDSSAVPLRLVVVLEDLHDTGANRVSLDRAVRWQAAGADVTLFVVAHENPASRVSLSPVLRIERATARPCRLRRALPAALREVTRLARQSDVVVAGTEVGFALLVAAGAARLARRPLAVSVQSRPDVAISDYVAPHLRALTRRTLVGADVAVCVSHGLVAPLVRLGMPVGRVSVAANAVDRPAIRLAAALAPTVPLPRDRPFVVGSGRLVRQKGFDILIRAHALALRSGAPDHRVVILGEGEEREPLLRLARDLGVVDSVLLAGFVDNPHAVVSRSALFVLSSRWEGFSLSLLEALACGTACLSFDCVAGPSEVLRGGAYGSLVEVDDVAGLADGIRKHLRDPRVLDDRVQRAVETEHDMFDPDGRAATHLAALADLAGRQRPRRRASSPRSRTGTRRSLRSVRSSLSTVLSRWRQSCGLSAIVPGSQ